MDKTILMMYTSRIAPEGSCPQRFDRQPFAEGKVQSVQIRGGAVKEKKGRRAGRSAAADTDLEGLP